MGSTTPVWGFDKEISDEQTEIDGSKPMELHE